VFNKRVGCIQHFFTRYDDHTWGSKKEYKLTPTSGWLRIYRSCCLTSDYSSIIQNDILQELSKFEDYFECGSANYPTFSEEYVSVDRLD
jgi:hypothetical protein